MTLSSPRRIRAGFTFIEILTVFVIVGVSMMIATRSVGDAIRRDRVVKTAVVLGADIEQAFAIAGRQRRPIRIVIDSIDRTFSVTDRANPALKYRVRDLETSDLSVDFLSTSTDTLDLMPSGFATDTLRLILGVSIRDGATHTQTIRMSRGGLVRIGKR